MVTLGKSYFGVIDYIAVALTLIVSLAIGLYHAVKIRGNKSNEDLLMGGRTMKAIPIAVSMIVTYFSAVSIIGFPAEIYSNGIQLFWMNILLTCICIPLAAFMFMSVLYKLKLTSAYEYLELRFDSILVRCFASGMFILQVTLMTGIAIYAPSIALEAFLGLPMWISILGIGICGTIYTSIGGLKAVVWTDVFQFCLIIIGMLSITIQGFFTAGGVSQAFHLAYEHERLELFNWNIDPFERYNTLNFILGTGMVLICSYGTHQQNVQRYSSLSTFREAIKSMVWNAIFVQIMNVLIIFTGVSIFASYATCDPIKAGNIKTADQIVPYFFVTELAKIPGMMGLFTSCIFSAVLSTLSSTLNSLAAVTWQDFLSRIPLFASMTTAHKGCITCILTAIYGIVTVGLAFVVGKLGSIFQVTVTVVGAFGGTVGSAFIMGLLLPCVNKVGACAGMIIGLFVTGFLTYKAYFLRIPFSTLPTSVEGCPAFTNFTTIELNNARVILLEYEWPTKLFSISYILYPFIGVSVSIITGIAVSLITKIFLSQPPESCYQYLHPMIKWLCGIQPFDEKPITNQIEILHDRNIINSISILTEPSLLESDSKNIEVTHRTIV